MIYKYSELEKLAEATKGKQVAFTSGCFDLLHVGHIKMLEDAKAKGDFLIVGVFPDSYVRERKGENRPIKSQSTRAQILNVIKSVDAVLLLTQETITGKLPVKAVLDVKPDFYVTRSKQWAKHKEKLSQIKTKVITLESKKIDSTSNLIKKILIG